MVSSKRPRSCAQYSNTRNTLHISWWLSFVCDDKQMQVCYVKHFTIADAPFMGSGLRLGRNIHLCRQPLGYAMHSRPIMTTSICLTQNNSTYNCIKWQDSMWKSGNDIDRHHLSNLLPVTTFLSSTRFGWRHCCSTRSSRTEVTGMPAGWELAFHVNKLGSAQTSDGMYTSCSAGSLPSLSLSILSFLRATISPVLLFLALSAVSVRCGLPRSRSNRRICMQKRVEHTYNSVGAFANSLDLFIVRHRIQHR